MYRKGPTESEAAAFGLTLEEAAGPAVDLWPDNVQAVNVFIAMTTQWRTGMVGATGLDYNVLPVVMRMTAVPRNDWPEVFDQVRIMEDAALQHMRSDK